MARLAWIPLALSAALGAGGCFYFDSAEDWLDDRPCDDDDDCVDGWFCATDGTCERGDAPGDAGQEDAGAADAGFDAGPQDGGFDAGPQDGGFDAGPQDGGFDAGPQDAGFDGGYDAGPEPNTPPVVSGLMTTNDQLQVQLTFTATDANASDSLLTALVDWGDGSAVENIANVTSGTPFVITHDYNLAGQYTVGVTAEDDDGAQSNEVTTNAVTTLPSDGLLLHVKFDGDLNPTVGPTLSSDGVIGFVGDRFNMSGRALDLYQGNNSGSIPNVSVPNLTAMTGSFTMAAWFLPFNGTFNGNDKRLLGQGDWMNIWTPSGGIYFGDLDGLFEESTPTGPRVGEDDIPDNEWTFYVGVVEQTSPGTSRVALYKNGALVQEATWNTLLNNPGTCRFYMGNWPSTNGDLCTGTSADEFQSMEAHIDDVRVFSRALADNEINALYREGNYFP